MFHLFFERQKEKEYPPHLLGLYFLSSMISFYCTCHILDIVFYFKQTISVFSKTLPISTYTSSLI